MQGILRLVVVILAVLGSGGCSEWQANRSSQVVDVDPFAIGTGEPVFKPAEGGGFINGEPLDMRSKR